MKSVEAAANRSSLGDKRLQRYALERVLDGFVSSQSGDAIVLHGAWGVGKTYFWNNAIVAKLLGKPWKKRYSYVSLFGINSLTELKVALAVATEEFDRDARKQRRLSRPVIRSFWKLWRVLSDLVSIIPKVGSSLSRIVDRIGFYMVRDRVICFDDIERHGKQLDLKDFLGLVSYLSELRACRVVVILNSKQLTDDDQKIWDEVREKVFQGELLFSPSPQETIELGLDADRAQPWHSQLKTALVELGISNIRLVRRASKFMHLACGTAPDRALRPETIESMARVVAMLVYSIHGRGAGGPPLDRVQNRVRLSAAVPGTSSDKRTDEEKEWDRTISDYRLYLHTGLDNALLDMVQAGYPDCDAMRAAFEDLESNSELYARKQQWHDAWRLYHDTVSENGEAIVEAFARTWPAVSAHEHATNLQSSARLLRSLGRSDMATQFIEQWVNERTGERLRELEAQELNLFRRIDDQEILSKVNEVLTQVSRLIPARDAFDLMRGNRGYPEHAIASLAGASIDELMEVIDTTVAEDLAPTIRRILELRSNHGDPNWIGASSRMQEACEQIAARSPLAADRMQNWFGIEVRKERAPI